MSSQGPTAPIRITKQTQHKTTLRRKYYTNSNILCHHHPKQPQPTTDIFDTRQIVRQMTFGLEMRCLLLIIDVQQDSGTKIVMV